MTTAAAVELYWIPLGAGQHIVRWSGRTYERVLAAVRHRTPRDLYHSALVLSTPRGRVAIEMTPIPRSSGERGVVVEGPVGVRPLGRLRTFRYEIRRWVGGSIPDVVWAVESPRRLSADPHVAERLFQLVPSVPALTWGRRRGQGEMWKSNSVVSWILARSGLDAASITPPAHGRAPGWEAGVSAASPDRSEWASGQVSLSP